jgi:Uma2 family endonuclease
MGHPVAAGLTATEFLAWEAVQPDKHEYLRGEIFAMVGATRKHVAVAMNVAFALRQKLAGTPCRVYMSDMKLRVEGADAFFYPDVLVTCDAGDHRAETYLSAPAVIVEVLSDSTAGYDRGEKFAAYRKLSTLREYVLIDPERKTIEAFRRTADGLWVLQEVAATGVLPLHSIAVEVGRQEVFEGVD